MELSKLSTKCRKCPFKDRCNGKELMAVAYIKPSKQELVMPSRTGIQGTAQTGLMTTTNIDIAVDTRIDNREVINATKEIIDKRLRNEFTKQFDINENNGVMLNGIKALSTK